MMNIEEKELNKAAGGFNITDLLVGDRPWRKFDYGDNVYLIKNPIITGYIRSCIYYTYDGWKYDVYDENGKYLGFFNEDQLAKW